jgi:hypothetical protein
MEGGGGLTGALTDVARLIAIMIGGKATALRWVGGPFAVALYPHIISLPIDAHFIARWATRISAGHSDLRANWREGSPTRGASSGGQHPGGRAILARYGSAVRLTSSRISPKLDPGRTKLL